MILEYIELNFVIILIKTSHCLRSIQILKNLHIERIVLKTKKTVPMFCGSLPSLPHLSENKSLQYEKQKFVNLSTCHCVKSVLIWGFSGPYFPAFGLNTERYCVFSPNGRKYGSEKLRIQTIFTQCVRFWKIHESRQFKNTLIRLSFN